MTQTDKINAGDQASPVFFNCDILDRLLHPVCILTSKSMIEYANNPFFELFEINIQEKKFDWPNLFCTDCKKTVSRNFIDALNGAFTSCLAEINTGDESCIPVEVTMQPITDAGMVHSVLVFITPLDEADDSAGPVHEVNPGDSTKNSYFEFSPFPIMRFGRDMKVAKLSRSFEGTLGYNIDDMVKGECQAVNALFKYDSEKIKNSILEVFRGNIPFKRFGEIKIKTNSGEERIVNIQAYPVYRDKEIHSIELIMEDITKLKELKARLSAMKRLNLINDIGLGFIHSINNTINVILNQTQYLQIITEKSIVSDGLKQIETYVHEVVDQLRRIQGFLEERGTEREEREEPLASIINDAVEFVRIHFKVDENRRKRSVTIDNDYRCSFNIKTDTFFLRELLIWAMLKVSVYSGKKSILRVRFVKGNLHYMTVSIDRTAGADSENIIPYTIDSFSPSEIRNAADKFNIKVIEEESPEQYSMRIIFPQRMIVEKTLVRSEDSFNSIEDRNIMIVEDEIGLQTILGNLFERMGNRVFITSNGSDAFEEFKKNHYDIVITDYDVAGLTGIELAARVKEINEDSLTILLSGWSMGDIKGYKGFVDLFMAKPFSIDDLVHGIASLDSAKDS
ncbi:MAG TPA: response regulator [Spirochaetota bacterium]|nr:response regulator [Spirochaetota bacterium]